LVKEVILDKILVKHWEYKWWITFKSLSLQMWKSYQYICFEKHFHKEKSKLCFGDCVAVLNDFFYQTGGSTSKT
jgi:hypothetical protein